MNMSKDNKNKSTHPTEENVLLISMSTLNRLTKNRYYWPEDEWHFSGVSQLEPGTKYILSRLDKEGKKLHRVVILETKESLAPADVLKDKDNKVHQDDQEQKAMSAVDFYIDQIRRYVEGREESELVRNRTQKLVDFEEHKLSYCGNPCEVAFQGVQISIDTKGHEQEGASKENDKIEQPDFLLDAVNKITGSKKDVKINLYMDMQGGIRSVITQMNAIVALLSERNVEICGRYAIDYNRDNNINTIMEVSREFDTYNLVTAMEVFRQYGRGDELLKYFEDADQNSFEKKLAKAIKMASDAIQLCNVDGFDEAIKAIAALEKEYQNPAREKSQMDIVYEDIREDYGSLMTDHMRYVQQIRWCLKKNFLQQALTILESKMPYEYVTCGLKFYCDSKKNKDKVLQQFAKLYQMKFVQRDGTPNKDAYKMKDLNHFFICDLKYSIANKRDGEQSDIEIPILYGTNKLKADVESNITTYGKIKGKRNQINHASSGHSKDGFYAYMHSQRPNDRNFKSNGKKEEKDIVTMIIEYLDQFEQIAGRIPEGRRKAVVDLA